MKVLKEDFINAYFDSCRSLRKTAKVLKIGINTAQKYFRQVKPEINEIEKDRAEKTKELYLNYEQAHISKATEIILGIKNPPVEKAIEVLKTAQNNFTQKHTAKEAALSIARENNSPVANTAFSDMLAKIKKQLTPYQVDFDESPKRFKGILSSTKAGKTFFGIYEILKNAFSANPKVAVWWVAPIYMQAEIAHKRISFMLRENNVTAKISKSPLKIEIDGHAPIFFKSADNPDSLYGEDVAFAIFDEFTRASSDAWTAIVSTLTATGGRCTLIGNYITSVNWGVKMVQKNAEKFPNEWDFFKVTAWQAVDAGVLKREVVEQAQRELHPFIFSALYLAEGSADELALFNFDAVEKVFEPREITNGEKYLTADIALEGSDLFVMTVWSGFSVIEIQTMQKSGGQTVVETIQGLQKLHNIPEPNIVFDADGVGGFVSEFLPLAKKFHGNGKPLSKIYANLRTRCYFELAQKINAGEIYIFQKEFSEKITEELLSVKKAAKDFEGKFIIAPKKSIRENIGRSPDFADALMMRMFFDIAPKNNFS